MLASGTSTPTSLLPPPPPRLADMCPCGPRWCPSGPGAAPHTGRPLTRPTGEEPGLTGAPPSGSSSTQVTKSQPLNPLTCSQIRLPVSAAPVTVPHPCQQRPCSQPSSAGPAPLKPAPQGRVRRQDPYTQGYSWASLPTGGDPGPQPACRPPSPPARATPALTPLQCRHLPRRPSWLLRPRHPSALAWVSLVPLALACYPEGPLPPEPPGGQTECSLGQRTPPPQSSPAPAAGLPPVDALEIFAELRVNLMNIYTVPHAHGSAWHPETPARRKVRQAFRRRACVHAHKTHVYWGRHPGPGVGLQGRAGQERDHPELCPMGAWASPEERRETPAGNRESGGLQGPRWPS